MGTFEVGEEIFGRIAILLLSFSLFIPCLPFYWSLVLRILAINASERSDILLGNSLAFGLWGKA